jgi:hypothetical protein
VHCNPRDHYTGQLNLRIDACLFSSSNTGGNGGYPEIRPHHGLPQSILWNSSMVL